MDDRYHDKRDKIGLENIKIKNNKGSYKKHVCSNIAL